MNNFSIIGIVGLQASGKTEIASIFMDLGAKRVRMGDVAIQEVKNRGLDINEENVAEAASELREKEGMDAVAKRCIPLIEEKGKTSDAVVVDGIRGIAEVERFKEKFGDNFTLISVEAPAETRFERTIERKREDDTKNLESFLKKDKRELSWGLEEAMKSPDYRIVNNGSLEDLREKTSNIFSEIMDKYDN